MTIADRFSLFAIKNSIPITVAVELTRRCPNRCLHCYIEETHTGKIKRKELELFEVKEIFSWLQMLGTVFVELTGGEPLLRDDIIEIVRLAVEKRFIVRLFSSLSLRCDDKLRALREVGLTQIDVSLYGGRETYLKITGRDNFELITKNIEMAKNLGFDITVKTPVMNINIDELKWIYDFTKRNKLKFRVDPVITPMNNGDKKTLKYSIKPEELKLLIRQSYIKITSFEQKVDYFPCGAMRSVFAINSYGDVYPCLTYPYIVGNIRKKSLLAIFNSKKAEEIRKILEKEPDECKNCSYKALCIRCPGVSYLYAGKADFVYESACMFCRSIKEVFKKFYKIKL